MRLSHHNPWPPLLLGCFMFISAACVRVEVLPATATTIRTSDNPITERPSSPTSRPSTTFTSLPETPTTQPSTAATPTLSPEEIQTEIRRLFRAKDTCKLPCFWGITPGETTWEEAVSILERVAFQFDGLRSTEGIGAVAWIKPPPDISQFEIVFNVVAYNEFVKIVKAREFHGAASLFLPQFLESNGQPEEVWMHGFKSFPDNHPPVRLFLHYPSKGVLAIFYTDGEVIKDAIRACWKEAPNLTLWAPDRPLSVREAENLLGYPPEVEEPIGKYRTLEEATGMSVSTFFTESAGPTGEVCLETPQSLWLDPYE